MAKIVTCPDVRSGNWNNVVMTYDGSQAVSGFSVYLNGNPLTVTAIINNTPSGVSNASDFNIGVRGSAGSFSNAFNGNIDEPIRYSLYSYIDTHRCYKYIQLWSPK